MVNRRQLLQTAVAGSIGLPLLSGRALAQNARSISYGQTIRSRIDTTDPRGYRGYYEPVTFQGSAGDVVRISMTSSDDTYLILLGPSGTEVTRNDDGGSGLDSRIDSYELRESGQYTIVATSYSRSDTFAYTLSLDRIGTGGSGTDVRSISYGETVRGEIDRGDPQGERGYYEPVTFQGSQGDVVTISMTSNDDTYLKLQNPSGFEVTSDDDGGSGLDSQIESYRLQESGQYTIIATSYSSSDTFEYELTLEEVGTVGGGRDLRSISYGETARGEIDTSDPQGERGYYEPVTFQGSQGDVVTISMTSDDDTYLKLQNPSGFEVTSDDDGGGGLDSQIESYRLQESGQYTIIATSFSRDDTFPYQLSLEEVGTGGSDLRSISYGETARGEIDTSDPRGERGYYEPVTFQGSQGDVVTISMTSDDDTYLKLQDPSGSEVTENDDGGSGLNSRIENYRLQESGQYTIIATSFSRDDTFPYTLSLEQVGESEGGGRDLRSISYGETARGEIDTSDPRGERGYYEPVTFQGSQGDVVTISMRSDDDTYLKLQDPSGSEVTENDDGGSGLNSRIEGYRLQTSGQYTIIATSYNRDDTFPYTLNLEADTADQSNLGPCEGTPQMALSSVSSAQGRITEEDPARVEANFRVDPNVPDDCTVVVDLQVQLQDSGFQFSGGSDWDQSASNILTTQFEDLSPGEIRSVSAEVVANGAQPGDEVTVVADYEIWYEGARDNSLQQSGIRETIQVEGVNSDRTGGSGGGGDDGPSDTVNVEVPGFGIGEAIAAVGSAGYMLKRRLTDDE